MFTKKKGSGSSDFRRLTSVWNHFEGQQLVVMPSLHSLPLVLRSLAKNWPKILGKNIANTHTHTLLHRMPTNRSPAGVSLEPRLLVKYLFFLSLSLLFFTQSFFLRVLISLFSVLWAYGRGHHRDTDNLRLEMVCIILMYILIYKQYNNLVGLSVWDM